MESNRQMRIISGKFRGKSINFLKNKITRPLKDSVKENIFNILMHSKAINIKLEKSNILDLYSGVGSFGLECLSRNAQFVTFVEKNLDALNVLKENVIKLSVKNQTEIIGYKIENTNKWHKKNKYNVFFLDPPFINNEYLKLLEIIKSKEIYNKNHIIIIHRERRTDDDLREIINPIMIKFYGRSKIIFAKFI